MVCKSAVDVLRDLLCRHGSGEMGGTESASQTSFMQESTEAVKAIADSVELHESIVKRNLTDAQKSCDSSKAEVRLHVQNL